MLYYEHYVMKILKVPIPASDAYKTTPCIEFCERILHCNKNDLNNQSIQGRRIHFPFLKYNGELEQKMTSH